MNLHEQLRKTVLLGTAKSQPTPEPGLGELPGLVQARQSDPEDGFLKYAAIAFGYMDAGRMPQTVARTLPTCPVDDRPPLPAPFVLALEQALLEPEHHMLRLVMESAAARGYGAPAGKIPELLGRALARKAVRPAVLTFAGPVGQWLIGLNPEWAALGKHVHTGDDVWETGTIEARRAFLQELRAEDPAKAIELLETAFPQESANNRAAFIEELGANLSPKDLPFLQSQIQDKSKKVKEAAMHLLRRIPGSPVQQLFLDFLERVIKVKEERYMIFSKRKVMEYVTVAEPSAEFFDAGIEKVSSQKGIADQLHWLSQVLMLLEPKRWQQAYGLTAAEFLELFIALPQGQHCVRALETAAWLHKDADLAATLLLHKRSEDQKLLMVVAEKDRAECEAKLLQAQPEHTARHLIYHGQGELSQEQAEVILGIALKNIYRFQRPEFIALGLRLPERLRPVLEKQLTPAGPEDATSQYVRKMWGEMLRMLDFKALLK